MTDLSKVPTADLEALHAGDLSKVSDATLQMLHDQNQAPDKRGIVQKGLDLAEKTLNVIPNAVKTGIMGAQGKLQDGEAGANMNPLSGKKIDFLEREGFGPGVEDVMKYHPMLALPRAMSSGYDAAFGTHLRDMLEKVVPKMSARDVGNTAIDTGLSMGSSMLAKGASEAAQMPQMLKKLLNGVLGTGAQETAETWNKGRLADKGANIYEKAFAQPQLKANVEFPQKDLIPLAKQAQDAKFSGSFSDFINELLPQNFQKGGRELQTLASEAGDVPTNPQKIIQRLNEQEQKVLSSSRDDRFAEASRISKMRDSIKEYIMQNHGVETPSTTREFNPAKMDYENVTQTTKAMPETIPASTAQKLKQDQMGYIYDNSSGLGQDKTAGLRGAEKAIMPIKQDISEAYGAIDPALSSRYEAANKVSESASPQIQKMLKGFATRQTELPTNTQIDALAGGNALKNIISHPVAAVGDIAGLAAKKNIQNMRAFKNSTAKAAAALNASELPNSSTATKAFQKAALLEYLDKLGSKPEGETP